MIPTRVLVREGLSALALLLLIGPLMQSAPGLVAAIPALTYGVPYLLEQHKFERSFARELKAILNDGQAANAPH